MRGLNFAFVLILLLAACATQAAGIKRIKIEASPAGPGFTPNASQTVDSIGLPGGGNWVVTAKFIANNATAVEAILNCQLTIGGVAKDNLGAGGTDFGATGDAAHTLTGAGAGNAAAIVCSTTATSASYGAISFTAVRVASIN